MRALLSTRLFAAVPLDFSALELARRAGFPTLELYATPRHLDVLNPGERRRLRHLLRDSGTTAPWLRASGALLQQLLDANVLADFADVLAELQVRKVTAGLRTWPWPGHGPSLDFDELSLRVEEAGAQLVIDAHRLDDPRLSRSISFGRGRQARPSWKGELSWDLANERENAPLSREEVDQMLGDTARGRLQGVRASHWANGHRAPPGTREAVLLEESFRLHAPGILIYDVDDPTGFADPAEYEDVLHQLRTFHEGGMRPPTEGSGGVFWASMAPG